jgi:hypothetical protein
MLQKITSADTWVWQKPLKVLKDLQDMMITLGFSLDCKVNTSRVCPNSCHCLCGDIIFCGFVVLMKSLAFTIIIFSHETKILFSFLLIQII